MGKQPINEDGNNLQSTHRVLSSNLLLSKNEKDIQELLQIIAKKYNVSVKDAAFALTNVFKNLSS